MGWPERDLSRYFVSQMLSDASCKGRSTAELSSNGAFIVLFSLPILPGKSGENPAKTSLTSVKSAACEQKAYDSMKHNMLCLRR